MSEHHEQAALFQWAAYNQPQYPQLALLFAIPNGAGLNHQVSKNGRRYSPEAAKLKTEGLKSGVPDVCLPCARGSYHGLYIELKYGRNTPSPQQRAWHTALREQGYRVDICYGWEPAAQTILDYLESKI
jgi:hypothetical protein